MNAARPSGLREMGMVIEMDIAELVKRSNGLHGRLANCHPKLARGRVWCHACGHTERVDPAFSLRHGWPKCCGSTMSIDSPHERALQSKEATDA